MAALPMLRLGSVLVPYMALRWRVFEERFLIMMANMLKTVQARFEVVLIESGHQLGAARRCPENDLPAGAGLSQNTKADWDVRPVDDSGRRSRAQAESSSDNAAVWRQISELPGFSVRRDRNARPKRDLALEMKRTSVPDILEILRDGYDEVDALTHKERDALPDAFRLATVACSAWRTTRSTQCNTPSRCECANQPGSHVLRLEPRT
jgi:hypothetical protein